ncbi:MAG: HlyD family secretion protein [Alphaproteobacteria bacterium]|nr:HlyD family secretion protein [Alphaproteobacteria bacterium]
MSPARSAPMVDSPRNGLDGLDLGAAAARPSAAALRRLLRSILLLLVPVAVAVVGVHIYLAGGRYVRTDNAYVRADKVTLGTDVSGVVAEISVRNDQRVEAGQILFRLNDESYRLALAGAMAQLVTVRNDIEALRATYRQKQEAIRRAESDIAYFRRDYDRQRELMQGRTVTQARLDESRHNLDNAQQTLAVLREEAAAARAALEGAPNAAPETYGRYAVVQALADKAERDLRQTVIRAPANGIVTNVTALQVGQYLGAGQAAFSLVLSDEVWIEANPKESDLAHVSVGNPATVVIDTYPDLVWSATVNTISPATGAEFALLPAQNSSGNWVKVVQRIPVRLRIDMPAGAPPLRAGMSASVEIDTGHRRSWPDFVRLVRRSLGLST